MIVTDAEDLIDWVQAKFAQAMEQSEAFADEIDGCEDARELNKVNASVNKQLGAANAYNQVLGYLKGRMETTDD